jgi:hypothetical protein
MHTKSLAMMLVAVAMLTGCTAGSTFHGWLEFGQWTPDTDSTVDTDGDDIDLVSTGGIRNNDSFWTYDAGIRFTQPNGNTLGAYAFNLGYFNHTYSGNGEIGSSISFDGINTFGTSISTNADIRLLKFTYEEPTGGSSGSERTGGLIGLHNLSYDIHISDGVQTGEISGTAPMFVVGYKVSYYSAQLMYFVNIEWMDLDTITLENVQGEVMDVSGGIRWVFDDSGNMAISAGYRSYDADLNMRDEDLSLHMEGAFFGFFLAW